MNKVTFTLSNLQEGSRYALINSATGELVVQGIAESSEVNLCVNKGMYDIRVRKVKWLPVSYEDILINKDMTFAICQLEDQIVNPNYIKKKINLHNLFDRAIEGLFNGDLNLEGIDLNLEGIDFEKNQRRINKGATL